jgi:Transglutaminase-like superfamily
MTRPPDSGPLSLRAKLRLVTEIVAAYGRVRWCLTRGTVPETVARIRARAPRSRAGAGAGPAAAVRLARVVGRTLDPLPADSRCLMRSLVLTTLLSHRGIDSTLVIGARSVPDFAAHAWVEVDGGAVLPDGGGEYGRLVEI